MTSIHPLKMIVRAVLGAEGDLQAVADSQQSSHHFTLKPSDRLALEQADLLIWIGPQFELELEGVMQQLKGERSVLTVSEMENLVIHEYAEGVLDPHLWLDTRNARSLAQEIHRRLVVLDQANEQNYNQNLQLFESLLERLDSELSDRFTDTRGANYIVFHDAYQYFERQWGLSHALALVDDPEQQLSMRDTLSRRQQLAELNARCLLHEADASTALIDTLLDGAALTRVVVDPLGYGLADQPGAYKELLLNIADLFQECLH